MVLIPNDIGLRMRLQNEAQLLQPPAPITEILTDLPEFRPGQQFTARILEVLPQGTYKALVAGKELTLGLAEGAKTGDTLELQVIDRSPRVLVAQLVPRGDASTEAAPPYPYTQLSQAARLIGALLPDEGSKAPPAVLNAGRPVLEAPPGNPATLAVAIRQAVRASGVFYEAHQAQWVTGRYPLAQLLDEPQAQHSDFTRLIGHFLQTQAGVPPLDTTLAGQTPGIVNLPGASMSDMQAADGRLAYGEGKSAPAGRQLPADTASERLDGERKPELNAATLRTDERPVRETHQLPDDLRPIVQQQLDALASDRIVWHGDAWPGQSVEWEIDRDRRDSGGNSGQDDAQWRTQLALTTPGLGRVEARIHLGQDGVRIAIVAGTDSVETLLRDGMPRLKSSLEAAGVPLQGFAVLNATHEDAANDAAR